MQSKIQLPGELSLPKQAVCPDHTTGSPKSLAVAADAVLEARFTAEGFHIPPPPQPELHAVAGRTNIAEPNRTSAEPDEWWRTIPAAMTWVADMLLDGFARYGEAMQPDLFFGSYYAEDVVDYRELARAPQWDRPTHYCSETSDPYAEWDRPAHRVWPWPADPLSRVDQDSPVMFSPVNPEGWTRSAASRTAAPRWSALFQWCVARLPAQTRHERKTTLTTRDPETLDDRILRDIGSSRYETEYRRGYRNHAE